MPLYFKKPVLLHTEHEISYYPIAQLVLKHFEITGENYRNIILWMDHRAKKEAEEINYKKHRVLQYVGGKISVEMETPKLLWLKRNLFETCWKKAGYFFDLPDFLTWMATTKDTR